MTIPEDYWRSFEGVVATVPGYLEAAETIAAYQRVADSRFVWRGVSDATYGLHSKITREYLRKHKVPPTERQLREFERRVLKEAREWGVDWHPTNGSLTALEVLARLQHYGVPTRLIDFTRNPLVALWFAVQGDSTKDGRVFAVDVSDQLITRAQARTDNPWWWDESPNTDQPWATHTYIWEAPPIEPRIVRQDGCFLMGGMPSTVPRRNLKTGPTTWRGLTADEVRQCMSVPFVLIG